MKYDYKNDSSITIIEYRFMFYFNAKDEKLSAVLRPVPVTHVVKMCHFYCNMHFV